MKNEKLCPLIQDLLPIYEDDAVSEESKRMLEKHLSECENCREYSKKSKGSPGEDRITEILRYQNIAKKIRRRRRGIIGGMALLIIAACIATAFFFQTIYVRGTCMEPAVSDQKRYLPDKWSYRVSNPQERDIVVYKSAQTYKVSRIVGVAGEKITIRDGNLYIDGEIEAQLNSQEEKEQILGTDQYYLLSDHPLEQRGEGEIVSLEDIVGKLVFVE